MPSAKTSPYTFTQKNEASRHVRSLVRRYFQLIARIIRPRPIEMGGKMKWKLMVSPNCSRERNSGFIASPDPFRCAPPYMERPPSEPRPPWGVKPSGWMRYRTAVRGARERAEGGVDAGNRMDVRQRPVGHVGVLLHLHGHLDLHHGLRRHLPSPRSLRMGQR